MYIFGPVPSRRLGKSLGVDLVPHKTCTLDCIYCECGATTNLTIQRKSFVPLDNVLQELDKTLEKKPQLDYITFSGSGEPTLSVDIGSIITYLKEKYPHYKIALLTNGTLLKDPSLRKDLLQIDLIIPSVDAISENVFQKINHPHQNIEAKDIISGITNFKKEFKGKMWIEFFVLPNINDDLDEIKKIKEFCLQLLPDKIQLNTLDRPSPHNKLLTPVSCEKLIEIKNYLSPLQVEVVKKAKKDKNYTINENINTPTMDNIIAFLKRRPATVDDLAESLGLKIVEVNKF